MHSNPAPRRQHSAELEAKVLAACDEPGASISGVALAHGLNANLVHKWRRGRGVKLAGRVTVEPPPKSEVARRPMPAASPLLAASPEFVALEMPAPAKTTAGTGARRAAAEPTAGPLIHVDLRRGPLHLSVRWPTSAADDCTAWLRELTTGLLK
ncbi:MAG: transposase [Burkholderiales bacterium]|nr:transposase [Burkholderiales bacterium]